MITYVKDKDHKPKRYFENHITVTSILQSIDKVVIIGATRTFVTPTVTEVFSIVVPITVGIAFDLSLGKKVAPKIVLMKLENLKSIKNKMKKTNILLNVLIFYTE